MLQAVSHVANSLGHLKTKYVKYLETLCAANGIDVQELKTCGSEYEQLEIFFGGYPVLVGLKYFKSLKVLKIFGQNTASLKPLSEVAGTLEELWVCEGQLKDLSGIELCTSLKKVYFYENGIEEGRQLAALTHLEILHLEENKLQNLSFLEDLQGLIYLNLADNYLTDRELSTVSTWPKKLQTLYLSNNTFISFKSLLPSCTCSSLRYIYVISPALTTVSLERENLYAWFSFHFRFLENLDGDDVQSHFTNTALPKAESLIAEKLNELATLEEAYTEELKDLDRSVQRVEFKLAKLCEVLEKLKETLPKKDTKREIAKRVLEVAHSNHRDVKPTRKKCRSMLAFIHNLMRYNVSLQLESAGTSSLVPATDVEMGILSHFLNFNCSMKHNYVVGIQHCVLVRPLRRNDMERLCFIEREEGSKIWSERELLLLLDHYNRPDYRTGPARTFKDVELLKKEVKEKTTAFFQPIFLNKPFYSAPPSLTITPASKENLSVPSRQMDKSPKDETAPWRDLHLMAIAVIEIQYPGHLHIGHLRHREVFDGSFDDQLKKLKEMNISVEIKESDKNRRISLAEGNETSLENIEKAGKTLKLKDILTLKVLHQRYSTFDGYEQCMTVRTPVEMSLAYGPNIQFTDLIELQSIITVLDLSSMKLTKLDGIETLHNLKYLSIRDNKLTTLKKLGTLNNLLFLDAYHNKILKVEELPESILELNLANNKLTSLSFCSNIPRIERLNITANYLKALRGVEVCTEITTLMAGMNQIKERSELDYLTHCTKLWLLDLTGNPVVTWEGYQLKILHSLNGLLTLDRQIVSKENRPAGYRCGRGLSIDFIDKCCPGWSKKTELNLCGHSLEIIVFESTFADNLSHITLINLSRNHLQEVKQLSVLPSLQTLVLESNVVRLLFTENDNKSTEKPFPVLSTLDLSCNELNSALLPRLGLKFLPQLKNLILKKNQIVGLNCQLFDLPCLETLDVSNNIIKSIKRHILSSLKNLDMSGNKLKDINGLAAPNLESLFLNENKLSTCASLTGINTMTQLKTLDCRGNPVVSRRVFVEYVKTQIPTLVSLNDASCEEIGGLPQVRAPASRRDRSADVRRTDEHRPEEFNTKPILYEYDPRKLSSIHGYGLETKPRIVHFVEEKKRNIAATAPVYQRNRNREQPLSNFMITGTKIERHHKL